MIKTITDTSTALSALELINTFSNPDVERNDYTHAVLDSRGELSDLIGEDETYPEIIPSIEQASKASRQRYSSGKPTPGITCLQTLQNIGFNLPMRFSDPVFEQFIRIYTISLFSGHINDILGVYLNIPNRLLKKTKDKLPNLSLIHSHNGAYRFKKGGQGIGRLLLTKGGVIGKKNQRLNMDMIMNIYTNLLNMDEETGLYFTLKNLIYALTDELINHRAKYSRKFDSIALSMPENISEKQSDEFARDVQEVLQFIFPKLYWNYKNSPIQRKNHINYRAIFRLKKREIKTLINESIGNIDLEHPLRDSDELSTLYQNCMKEYLSNNDRYITS